MLTRANIEYHVVDVDSQEGERLSEKLGVEHVPTVFLRIGTRYELIDDDTPKGIRRALEAAG